MWSAEDGMHGGRREMYEESERENESTKQGGREWNWKERKRWSTRDSEEKQGTDVRLRQITRTETGWIWVSAAVSRWGINTKWQILKQYSVVLTSDNNGATQNMNGRPHLEERRMAGRGEWGWKTRKRRRTTRTNCGREYGKMAERGREGKQQAYMELNCI